MMHLLIQLLELVVIGWLPGAAMFRGPWLNRERRAALDAEERVFWAVILSLAVSLSVVLALASVHRYSFRNLILADLAVAALCVGLGRGHLRLGATAGRVSSTAAVPVLLIVLGVWRFFPPAEYVIGGKDPGVYMNEGIQIAQRGGLVIRDPIVAAVPTFARPLFFPPYGQTAYDSLRFMGFFITDLDTGTCRRTVSASVSRLDRRQLWNRRTDGRASDGWSLGRARTAGRLFRRGPGHRTHCRHGRRCAPGVEHHPGLVRKIPECRSGDAGAAVRCAAGQCACARGRRSILCAGRRISPGIAFVRAVRCRIGDCRRRRSAGARPVQRTATPRVVRVDAGGRERPRRVVLAGPDAGLCGPPHHLSPNSPGLGGRDSGRRCARQRRGGRVARAWGRAESGGQSMGAARDRRCRLAARPVRARLSTPVGKACGARRLCAAHVHKLSTSRCRHSSRR